MLGHMSRSDVAEAIARDLREEMEVIEWQASETQQSAAATFSDVVSEVLLSTSLPLGAVWWWGPRELLALRSVCRAFRLESNKASAPTGEFFRALLLRFGIRVEPSFHSAPSLYQLALRAFNERAFVHGLKAVAARAVGMPLADPRVQNLVHVAGSFALHRYQHLSEHGAACGGHGVAREHGAATCPAAIDASWAPDDVDIWVPWLEGSVEPDASVTGSSVGAVLAAVVPYCKASLAYMHGCGDEWCVDQRSDISGYSLMENEDGLVQYSKQEAICALHRFAADAAGWEWGAAECVGLGLASDQDRWSWARALVTDQPADRWLKARSYSLRRVVHLTLRRNDPLDPYTFKARRPSGAAERALSRWDFPCKINVMQYVKASDPMSGSSLAAEELLEGFDIVPAMVAYRVTKDLRDEFVLPSIAAHAIASQTIRLGPHAFKPARDGPARDVVDIVEVRKYAVQKALEKEARRVVKYMTRGFRVSGSG